MTNKNDPDSLNHQILQPFHRYRLDIAYDGSSFCGWQKQHNGISIQESIEKALSIFLRHPTSCHGSGRTDAGVHAKGQVAHFDSLHQIDEKRALLGLNALLPQEIRIFNLSLVPNDFHARYSAKRKIYHYHLEISSIPNPLHLRYVHHIFGRFDLNLVKEAIPYFLGTKDFFSFANEGTKGSAAKDAIRTLYRIDLVEMKDHCFRLEFEGDGFLYKMVRNITGTLIEIGRGKQKKEEIPSLFLAKDRRKAPMTAPAHALFLMKVIYEKDEEGLTPKHVQSFF